MNKKLPILFIVPHGGYKIPEELSQYTSLSKFDIFLESDTCANDLSDFGNQVHSIVNTNISRLFVDLDRPIKALPPKFPDGVIKNQTQYLKLIYKKDLFPDSLAISNIIDRYYLPFHKKIANILKSENIKLIIDFHTMMAVAPDVAEDSKKPRPLVSINNIFNRDGEIFHTCENILAEDLLENLRKSFSGEKSSVTDKFKMNNPQSSGHILETYSNKNIPMLRFSISKALFLNDKFFSYEYMKVDELRLRELKMNIWKAIEKFFKKYF
ncbi:N-formylglutamate amidohydrolase [Spirochaetota bacterium]